MKVKVDSNLRIYNVFEPPVELELQDDNNSFRDLLQILSEKYPFMKFLNSGEMGDDLRHVFLNGESHFSFPEGLNKRIKEGDNVRVEVYMDPLAGG